MKIKAQLFVPISKVEEQPDGTLLVYGKCTGPDLDADKQIMDPAWLAKAVPEWFASGANVREMHQPIAAGVGEMLEQLGDDWYLKSLVVDPGSIDKVKKKVLKGYSIGIGQGYQLVKDAKAPGGRVVGGPIVEVSLVDRGSNHTCKMAICKADGVDGDVLVDVAEEELEDVTVADIERLVAALLANEAQELLDGGEATGAIRALLWVLDDLDWFQEIDSYEDAISKAAAATTKGSTVNLTELTASVGAAAGDDATDEQKAALADLTKALFPDGNPEAHGIAKAALAELLKIDDVDKLDDEEKETVSTLRKVLGIEDLATTTTKTAEASEELKSELEARLVKVEELAAPGGPDRTRPADPVKTEQHNDLLTKAREYRTKAATVADPNLADGYRKLAKQAELSAAALGITA